jgi:carbonic anhydrase
MLLSQEKQTNKEKLISSRDVAKLDPNARRPSNIVQLSNERNREQRLEESFVLQEVDWLRNQKSVMEATRDRGLKIHAFVYDKARSSCVRLVED